MLLIRSETSSRGTPGSLVLANGATFRTLELPWRENESNRSCIPTGLYRLRVRSASESQRFSYRHVELLDVPGRSAILIHAANWPAELRGCIAPGYRPRVDDHHGDWGLWPPSREAVEEITRAVRRGDDRLTIAWRGDLDLTRLLPGTSQKLDD